MKIILGSSSKYQKAVLEKAGYQFETMSPDIDEKAIRTDKYYELPLLIARAKANALLSNVIEKFIAEGDPFSRAGGFAIQSPILQPYITKIEGAEDSIMGMPLGLLEKLMKEVSD